MNIRNQVFGVAASAKSPLVTVKQPKGARADELLSIAVERTTGRCGDTRSAERPLMVIESAVVSWKQSDHLVQLINLSDGGAMIAGDFAPKLWDRVKLHRDSGSHFAAFVSWIKQGRVGLEFASARVQ